MKSPKLDGADLRKRRHSLGLTLEEASRGICSVAYLSLIEQGQRDASDRITELLFARMNAAESDAGTSVQVTALKVVELELRQLGELSADTRGAAPLKNHELCIQALECEARGEMGAAIALIDEWLDAQERARDLRSFGARIRVRMLREADRDGEAIAFAAKILAVANPAVKNRQDDLLEVAFQLASLYSAAGAWRDAIHVLEAQASKLKEPRQVVNHHWALSDALYAKGDVGAALHEARAALAELENLDLPVAAAKLEANTIWYELLSGKVAAARQGKRLMELEAQVREANDATTVASILSTRALLAARKGEPTAMLELARQALGASLKTRTREYEELAVSLGEIGLSVGQTVLAEFALQLIDSRDRAIRATRAEAALLHRTGSLAARLGMTERANAYYSVALAKMGFNAVAA